jgi:hypothetical protein
MGEMTGMSIQAACKAKQMGEMFVEFNIEPTQVD